MLQILRSLLVNIIGEKLRLVWCTRVFIFNFHCFRECSRSISMFRVLRRWSISIKHNHINRVITKKIWVFGNFLKCFISFPVATSQKWNSINYSCRFCWICLIYIPQQKGFNCRFVCRALPSLKSDIGKGINS